MSVTDITPLAMNLAQRNLLTWVGSAQRSHGQAMEAWRSSCPQLSVWEDALLDGLVLIDPGAVGMAGALVNLTPLGRARLATG